MPDGRRVGGLDLQQGDPVAIQWEAEPVKPLQMVGEGVLAQPCCSVIEPMVCVVRVGEVVLVVPPIRRWSVF